MTSSLEELLRATANAATAENDDHTSHIDMRQEICNAALREPHLDAVFHSKPHLRWEFYREMALLMQHTRSGGGVARRGEAPASFQAYSHALHNEDTSVADCLLDILHPRGDASSGRAAPDKDGGEGGLSLAEREVRGFVYFFATKTGSAWGADGLTPPAMSLAHLLAAAGSENDCSAEEGSSNQEDGHLDGAAAVVRERLRKLFVTLYHFHATLLLPTQGQCFAHAFEILFRLLLQYHDPLLALHLDQRQVDVGTYAYRWVHNLLVGTGGGPATAVVEEDDLRRSVWPLWDLLLLHQEPLLCCFVVVVAMIERRSDVLQNCPTADDCHRYLAQFRVCHAFSPPTARATQQATPTRNTSRTSTPSSSVVPSFSMLPPCERAKDLFVKAKLALRNTPLTAQVSLRELLFPDAEFLQRDPCDVRENLLSYVALPVDSVELVSAFASPQPTPPPPPPPHPAEPHRGPGSSSRGGSSSIGYVILDCRSTESFQFARLPTALHVGDSIGFDAELLKKMRERFDAARGSHLCILGTGRALVEEVNLLKLIVLHLVQHGFPYVSVATGGFRALIPYIKSGKVEFVRGGGPKVKRTAGGGTESEGSSMRQGAGCIPLPPQQDCAPQPAAASSTTITETAEELKAKAASWGWGFVKAMSEKVDELRRPKPPQGVQPSTGIEGSPSTTPPQSTSPTTVTAAETPAASHNTMSKEQAPLFTTSPARKKCSSNSQTSLATQNSTVDVASANRAGPQNDEDDEDELDLITSVDPSPSTARAAATLSSPEGRPSTKHKVVEPSPSVVETTPSTKPTTKDLGEKPAGSCSTSKVAAVFDDEELDFLYTSPPARVASQPANHQAASVDTTAPTPSSRPRISQSSADAFDDIFV